jgi:hypothetical protein
MQAKQISEILANLDTHDFSIPEIKEEVVILEKAILELFVFLEKD